MDYKIERLADVLFLMTKKLKMITEKAFVDYGIGIGQLQVLFIFYTGPIRGLTQQELVKVLEVDKGNVSRNVAKLQSKGLLVPAEDHTRHYNLTNDGVKLKGDLMDFFMTTHNKMIEGITEDDLMTTFASILKMNENLGKMG